MYAGLPGKYYLSSTYNAPGPPSHCRAVTNAATYFLNEDNSHLTTAAFNTGPFGDRRPLPWMILMHL